VIDKYIGDAVMAFWGPPFTTAEDHASAACWAALAQLDTLDTLRQRLPEVLGFRGQLPPINIRVGLATGEVIVGTIGSDVARSYTVLGDTVNVAARLESANKQYGTRLLLSEATWQMARDAIETRELDSIQVVGKSEPVRIFELLARKGDLTQARADLREHFEHGLQAYRTGDWLQAQDAFQACLTLAPHDTPSRVFLERLQYLQAHPPADQWDGVWRLVHK
jgi:adenylate cyclase